VQRVVHNCDHLPGDVGIVADDKRDRISRMEILYRDIAHGGEPVWRQDGQHLSNPRVGVGGDERLPS
jgi:hypothetical protein